MNLPSAVEIIEVGLRDGLQAETTLIPTDVKREYIERLLSAGLKRLQVTAFVHPTKVPQMADAEALCAMLEPIDGVEFSGLVLNTKGLERLASAGLTAVDMGVSASNTHSQKNTGQPTDVKVLELREMIQQARTMNLKVRAGIQCAFGCAYEGDIAQEKVLDIARTFLAEGIDELAIADSTGMANPRQLSAMLTALQALVGTTPIVLHLHDTRGLGLANVVTALQHGVTRFDTAFGGLGGCPFIQGATGNIATEDTLNLCASMGIQTHVDWHRVAEVSRDIAQRLGKPLDGKLYKLAQ